MSIKQLDNKIDKLYRELDGTHFVWELCEVGIETASAQKIQQLINELMTELEDVTPKLMEIMEKK